MKITRAEFDAAALDVGIDADLGSALWQRIEAAKTAPAFTATNVLLYAGALIIIAAMTLYIGTNWDDLSGMTIAVIGLCYGGVALAGGEVLVRRPDGRRIAGGLLVVVALAMVPMITYGIQVELGLWPGADPGRYGDFTRYIRGGWFAMEIATLAVGAALLRRYRFPFLLFVLGVVLWFMSMDITPLLYEDKADWFESRRQVSVIFGLLMLAGAYATDLAFRKDYAFWLYLFGMMTFWGAVTATPSSTELLRFVYFVLNVGLITLSVFLRRRVFMVFGVCGIISYFGHLAFDLFVDSPWFPFALSGFGVLVLLAGLALVRYRLRLNGWVEGAIPAGLQSLRPDRG